MESSPPPLDLSVIPFRYDVSGRLSYVKNPGGGRWTLDPAYIVNRFDSSKPTTILIPSK